MTPEAIARLRANFAEVSAEPRVLAGRFYEELFAREPRLRGLFPVDLTYVQGHFEAAIALVLHNFEDMSALQDSLRDLGAQHVGWGARPGDYRLVREALVTAIRKSSAQWDDGLEQDWRRAITRIIVPMLQGAAVETAVVAEQLADES
jgi:hemoglobin-like flavoprotein